MDLLKTQLDRIQQQLGGLSASQKMLTASLVAIMVMTLLWWGRYAGQAEMVPLLEQGFASEDIAQIKGQLRSAGIAVKVDGDRVLVPADKQGDAIASLAYADVLPDNMVDGFEEMSQRMTPWDGGPQTEALMKRAKEITLRQVIRRFPGVKDAIVLIEPGAGRRTIGGVGQASASLSIEMDDGGTGDRKLADAAANLVSGAQQGLKPGGVKVVIGGKQYRLDDKSGLSIAASDEISEMTAETEMYLEDKLQGMWPYIHGVIAKVSVDIEHKTSQLQSKKFDKDNALSKEKSIDSRTEESIMPNAGGAEPGIMPNTGMSVESRPQVADATKTSEETKTEMENFVGESIETVNTPAGKVTVVGASVRVPRTHFVEAFKKRYAGLTQPDPAAMQAYIDDELAQMAKEVQRVTHVEEVSSVTVALYDDVMPMMAATTTVPVSGTVATTVSGHAKEIAIGALAVISLFMVSTMVRKGTPAPTVAAAAEHKGAPHLSTGNELAGEAGEGDSMLDGMELDEDAVRAQQMLDQVSTMVEENPDAAANIMKRWLNRS